MIKQLFGFFIACVLWMGAASAANELILNESADFGPVVPGTSTLKTFSFTNTGAETIYFITMYLGFTKKQIAYYNGDFPGQGGSCGWTILPQETCTFIMSFAPSAEGVVTSFIKMNYDYGTTPQVFNTTLVGTGGVPASLVIEGGDGIDFGSLVIGQNKEMIVNVLNAGQYKATQIKGELMSPFYFKGGSFPGDGGNCPNNFLSAKYQCSMVVVYAPNTKGPHTGQLVLNYDDGVGPQSSTQELEGKGVF